MNGYLSAVRSGSGANVSEHSVDVQLVGREHALVEPRPVAITAARLVGRRRGPSACHAGTELPNQKGHRPPRSVPAPPRSTVACRQEGHAISSTKLVSTGQFVHVLFVGNFAWKPIMACTFH